MAELEACRFTKTHEWIHPQGGTARVGITDHAQKEITDVVFVELPKIGRQVQGAEACAIVESVKAAFDIYAPIAGEIVSVSGSIGDDPGAVNRSPYGDGWLFELKPSNPKDVEGLMTHDEYQEFLKSEKH